MSGTRRQVIEADHTLLPDGRMHAGVRVAVGPDGRIAEVGPAVGPVTHRLSGHALVPGFVNAHSHAFQRGLRGHGERFPAGAGSFWTWREAMYGLVDSMTPERVERLATRVYREMRDAGITTVGEFHYLHHAGADEPDFELDEAVVRAARAVGIRLVLLQGVYRAGGFDRPLEPSQRRFATPDLEDFWRRLDARAATGADAGGDPRLHLGVVAHSVRAVAIDDVVAIHAEARRRGLVLHMHLEEQPKEIEDCLARHGQRPMRLLLERGVVDERFTAVHATHTIPEDLDDLARAGGSVCVCPLTEANLGDGAIDGPRLVERGAGPRCCLGTDSNARVDMLEEMRWLELGQRLVRQRRGVLVDADGDNARVLWRAATEGGAASLGIAAGRIEPGTLADLAAIDLGHPAVHDVLGGDPDRDGRLPAILVFGGDGSCVAATAVGGRWRVREAGRTVAGEGPGEVRAGSRSVAFFGPDD